MYDLKAFKLIFQCISDWLVSLKIDNICILIFFLSIGNFSPFSMRLFRLSRRPGCISLKTA